MSLKDTRWSSFSLLNKVQNHLNIFSDQWLLDWKKSPLAWLDMPREIQVCAESTSYTPNILSVTHITKLTYLAKINLKHFIHWELWLPSYWWEYKLKNISILCALNYSLVKWCDHWDIWKYKPIYHFQIQGYMYVQPDTISCLKTKLLVHEHYMLPSLP